MNTANFSRTSSSLMCPISSTLSSKFHVRETRVEADALSDQAICCPVLKGQSRVKRVSKLRWIVLGNSESDLGTHL
jgi:hypothetical protein